MNLLSILVVFGLVVGCAKNRDPDPLRAGQTEDFLTKADFTIGQGKEKSSDRAFWLGKMTVVNTSDSPAGTLFVGFQGDVKAGYFDFTQQTLQFKSMKGLYGIEESENIKNSVLLSWNIEHLDRALDVLDGQTTNNEIIDNFKTFEKKRFFRINWGQTTTNETQMLPSSSFAMFQCWQPVSVRRVDNSMKIEPDHIGFKVEVVYQRLPACANSPQWNEGDFNFKATFMYSFKKYEANSDYQRKLYANEQDPKRYKYGHFQTVLRMLRPSDGRPHNLFMENRWAEKTQTFYFVKGFPQEYKWMWDHNLPHSIFGQTNALLESVGSKLRFEIYDYNHEGREREFGDLRYSFVNYITKLEAGGTPFGYGPSDTDPFTGEIIAANTMVWTGFLDMLIDRVKTIVDVNQKESSLFAKYASALNLANGDEVQKMVTDWDQTKGVGAVFKQMAQATRFTHPYWNSYTLADTAGTLVVADVVDKYGKTVSLKTDPMSGFSADDIVGKHLGTTHVEGLLMGGKAQVRVGSPYDIIDTSWLERVSARANVANIPSAGQIAGFLDILNNLNSAVDPRSGATGGLKEIARQAHQHHAHQVQANQEGHCILDFNEFAGGFAGWAKLGKIDLDDPAEVKDFIDTVLFRVSIHEFGHNLNLRHNFYGSVDKASWNVDKYEGTWSPKLKKINSAGEVLEGERVQVSSSVMDYLALQDEINTPWTWEDYDVAAILDSYHPEGFDDKGHLFLFCTDEHTATSALCNRHDLGTTPSQILMSQIRSYDERYEYVNKRWGRDYWNTSGYNRYILTTMVSMKEFLPMWRAAFRADEVNIEMAKMGITNPNEQKALYEELNREMRNVMQLTMGFYQAVIQQSRGERDFRSRYDEVTGAVKQIGIMPDKIYAMLLLAGDDSIWYHPNRVMIHNSFLTYSNEGNLSEWTDQIWRNIVTDRNIAMEPWFINFARFQYAKNATNFYNRGAADLIGGLRIVKINTANDLFEQYGVEMEVDLPAMRVTLPKSTTATFDKGDDVVVVHVDGDYYMTKVSEGDVTYTLFQNALDKLTGKFDDDASITQFNMDVRELYWLYNMAESGALQ